MAVHIPENILEDILSRVDIVEVVSNCIPIRNTGKNFKALCPFHHEKTPSFMVSPDRQIYHCFGCGAGGNAFNFLMQYERLEFIEAVEVLARKAGITLPQSQKQDSKEVSLFTHLYRINELTGIFYEQILNSPAGSAAKDYLLKRGIKQEVIKLFKIGYAVDKWDGLINHLRAKNINLSLIEKAGLILSKEGGGYYDRFRNRVIFPIFDVKSRVLGFGARVLDNNLPKYVNSPETSIYTKGKNLYGLNFSKDAIRQKDYVVIVEGYLDFIMPYQQGIDNIVASLGTALTCEQVRLLKRYTHNVVMVYDADDAGQMATLRTLEIFIEEDMNVKVVSLPEGFDPDSFVKGNGVDKFKEKISLAKNLFEYKLNVLKRRYNPKEVEGKAKISSEILPTISKFKNEVLKSEYVKQLAEELNIREEALLREINKVKKEDKTGLSFNPGIKDNILTIHPLEKLLVKLMLEEKGIVDRIKQVLEPSDFQDERVSRIVSIIFSFIEQGKKIDSNNIINYVEDKNISKLICESVFMPEVALEEKEKIVDDCIHRLKKQGVKIQQQRLHEQIKTAQNTGDIDHLHRLMREFDALTRKR